MSLDLIIMKTIRHLFLFLFLFLFSSQILFADDFDSLYDNLETFSSRLYNDIDPFEDEDNLKYAYNPYPLFRTSAYLYFKEIVIPPGYYSITPRKLKDKYYLFFKQGGKVQFIIPIAKKELTPINFYKANIPERKKTKWQKFAEKTGKKFYKLSKNSQKVTPPSSFVQVEQNSIYIIVIVYYGEDKYTALFRKTPY